MNLSLNSTEYFSLDENTETGAQLTEGTLANLTHVPHYKENVNL